MNTSNQAVIEELAVTLFLHTYRDLNRHDFAQMHVGHKDRFRASAREALARMVKVQREQMRTDVQRRLDTRELPEIT